VPFNYSSNEGANNTDVFSNGTWGDILIGNITDSSYTSQLRNGSIDVYDSFQLGIDKPSAAWRK
jgi:hypothetical protein